MSWEEFLDKISLSNRVDRYMDCQRLVLGTAQLGADYGIAYTSKKITSQEFQSIMCAARDAGVHSIDTAMAYGDSQKILGEIGVDEWSITTKLPSIPDEITSIEKWYSDAIASSLSELRLRKINTLLIHDVRELSGRFGSSLIKLLRGSKIKGDVLNIGVSIYAPHELDAFYHNFQPDIVQCPYNVFDQRIFTSGWLQKLSADKVELHARSVFLQGVILRGITELSSYFDPWYSNFESWENFCRRNSVSKLQAALEFVKAEKRIDKIIVGIESRSQLEQIFEAYRADSGEIFVGPCEDVALVNPLMWEII
ncbi:aldo/keto reductase [Pseudomonadales bacterium]|nr:aldo/keto reductase [Pseudomonadales bacterium]